MTALIALMNKQGIALAGDSALTVGGSKVHHGAQKIFRGPEQHQIALMTFGNAEVMGLPCEVIIADYFRNLGDARLATLDDYLQPLIDCISSHPILVERQIDWVPTDASGFFHHNANLVKQLAEESNLRDANLRQLEMTSTMINEQPLLALMKAGSEPRLDSRFCAPLTKALRANFDGIPLDSRTERRWKELYWKTWPRDYWFSNPSTNIVIAGYGEKDRFPGLFGIEVEAVADSCVKCALRHDSKIGFDRLALIYPFAQSDTVWGFIDGISPEVNKRISDSLLEILSEHEDEGLPQEQAEDIYNRFCEKRSKVAQDSYNLFDAAVGSMPISQLASTAENLIRMTSFRHKLVSDVQSVGGKVRAATITTGDGFSWCGSRTGDSRHHGSR